MSTDKATMTIEQSNAALLARVAELEQKNKVLKGETTYLEKKYHFVAQERDRLEPQNAELERQLVELREAVEAIQGGSITCVSKGDGRGHIRIQYPILEEAQRVHVLIAALGTSQPPAQENK